MVSEKKKKLVLELTKSIQAYPVISLVNMENLPAKQLQNIRAQLLKKDIIIVMARKKLLQLALKNSQKKNIEQLIQKIKGVPALLLSKENPFILYSILQKNKSSAPAKPNQTAPKDLIVPAGPTSFAPGPIISELAGAGIKTKVEEGKLVIVEDAVVAKEDEVITQKLAEILKRLDIQPMEIGLNLVAAWENEIVFDAKQLYIDEEEYFNNLGLAHQEAFNLAMEIAYPTSDNIELFLQKAFQESKTLALEQEILTDITAGEILAKTEQQALALKEEAKIEVSTEPKKAEEVPVEEPKEEEKPEEEKKEEPETPVEEKKEEVVEEETPKEEEKPEEEKGEEPKEEETPAQPEEKEEQQVEEKEKPEKEEQKEESEEEKSEEKPEEKEEEPVEEPKKEPEPTPEPESKKEEPVEEEKEEEPKEEETPAKEEPKEEEEEEKKEEVPVEEPKEKVEDNEESKPEEEKQDAEDIPSAEDMIKATKERFTEKEPEKEEEAVEVKTSAEDMVKATKEAFDPKSAKEKESQPSAEELVEEEKEEAEKEKPKEDKEMKEAESLLEKLKKKGTLRE